VKQVLIISYYFPPSGGPGVQRTLKFVKYFRSFGWEPTVLTVEPRFASFPDLDPALSRDVPDGIDIIRTRSRDPYAAYARWTGARKSDSIGVGFLTSGKVGWRERAARWIRANVFLPDARVGWVAFARQAALSLTLKKSFDAVLTTGPPHSAHLVGLALKKKLDIPWIVDLRDSWPDDSYAHLLPTSRWAASRDARLRRGVYESSDRIVTVSPSIKESTSRWTQTEIDVIYNGYDEDDFEGIQTDSSDTFTIVYTGNLSSERNPQALWRTLSDHGEAFPELRVKLIGNVGAAVHADIIRFGLSSIVSTIDYVPHSEALARMSAAQVLLLSVNRVPEARGIITGKIFEYLGSGRPILCLAPTDGDAADIIRQSRAGQTFDYDDVEGFERELRRLYAAWQSGNSTSGAGSEAIKSYSRRVQTGVMARLLDQISSGRSGGIRLPDDPVASAPQ